MNYNNKLNIKVYFDYQRKYTSYKKYKNVWVKWCKISNIQNTIAIITNIQQTIVHTIAEEHKNNVWNIKM